jgi:hypothetical protein
MQNVELTQANIEYAYNREEWLGFGYLGERENAHAEGKDVSAADAAALAAANKAGLTGEQFFYWLNSKNGRWFGDCWFGANGQHAERYAPGQPQL